MATDISVTLEEQPVAGTNPDRESGSERIEIDTSAPFESVREAANRFGGMCLWRPISPKNISENDNEMFDTVKVEEQAAQLERELITKERETLDVLKELEITKMIIAELKLKLQENVSQNNVPVNELSLNNNVHFVAETAEKENLDRTMNVNPHENGDLGLAASAAPGIILKELKEAKVKLTRATSDLADIRATANLYKKKIESEGLLLEKTRQRLSSNTSKISSLEDEFNQTMQKLEMSKDTEVGGGCPPPSDVTTRELQRLSSEIEQLKNAGNSARSEGLRALSEIEQTKCAIKTAEIRLVAANTMKEAARASEAVALAEIKALSHASEGGVTLTVEEYSTLISRAREAKEACEDREADALLKVDDAKLSNSYVLKMVEEVTEEVKISKKALEEALSRVEASNRDKLAVEEALRKWRSDHGQKRRNVHNSTKFKNSYSSLHGKESHMLDINDTDLVGGHELKPVLKPTLSIGQILSRKIILTEEYENGLRAERNKGKRKVSLAQMLSSKQNTEPHSFKKSAAKENIELPPNRKKFSFGRITLLMSKQSNKKKTRKKQSAISMCRSS